MVEPPASPLVSAPRAALVLSPPHAAAKHPVTSAASWALREIIDHLAPKIGALPRELRPREQFSPIGQNLQGTDFQALAPRLPDPPRGPYPAERCGSLGLPDSPSCRRP